MSGLKLVLVGKQQRVAGDLQFHMRMCCEFSASFSCAAGLHIIGPCADEIVQGFAVAVRMGATLQVEKTPFAVS